MIWPLRPQTGLALLRRLSTDVHQIVVVVLATQPSRARASTTTRLPVQVGKRDGLDGAWEAYSWSSKSGGPIPRNALISTPQNTLWFLLDRLFHRAALSRIEIRDHQFVGNVGEHVDHLRRAEDDGRRPGVVPVVGQFRGTVSVAAIR